LYDADELMPAEALPHPCKLLGIDSGAEPHFTAVNVTPIRQDGYAGAGIKSPAFPARAIQKSPALFAGLSLLIIH